MARFAALRDEFAQRATKGRFKCARSAEWAAMPVEVRALLLFVAGVDGEPDQLARRGWREMPEPEREAVRGAMRSLSAVLRASPALLSRWGDA